MDLKRVNKISQRYKNIVSGFIRRYQRQLPKESAYYNISDLINHLILLYYYKIFETKILSDTEQEEFLNLLTENKKSIANDHWKLIFDSKKDGLDTKTFIAKVFDHDNILLLIQLKKECVIGEYTKTGWSKDIIEDDNFGYEAWSADKDAFAFYFKSSEDYKPFISNVKEGKEAKALGYNKERYGTMGQYWLFFIFNNRFNEQGQWNDGRATFEPFGHKQNYLTGSYNKYSATKDIVLEVFQIES